MSKFVCFVPFPNCQVSSGDCFTLGKCLNDCTTRLTRYDANVELSKALRLLKELADWTQQSRSVTRYVDGSSVDFILRDAKAMILKFKKQ